jgi:hypothetical protein
MATEE